MRNAIIEEKIQPCPGWWYVDSKCLKSLRIELKNVGWFRDVSCKASGKLIKARILLNKWVVWKGNSWSVTLHSWKFPSNSRDLELGEEFPKLSWLQIGGKFLKWQEDKHLSCVVNRAGILYKWSIQQINKSACSYNCASVFVYTL